MNDYYLQEVNTAREVEMFESILAKTLYPDGDVKERCKWFYEQGPSVRFLLYSRNLVDPIGTIGYGLRYFLTPLGTKLSAQAVDFAVLKDHRDIQAAFYLVEEGKDRIFAKGIDFIFSTPNRHAKGIIKRTRAFECVGTFQRHIKLVSFGEVLQNTKFNFATPVVDLAWRGVTKTRNLMLRNGTVDFTMGFIDANLAWATRNTESTTMGVRGRAYLNWRYTLAPGDKYRSFHFTHNGKHAYLVYMIIKNRAYVIDVLYPVGDTTTAVKMFASFEHFCQSKRYSMIVVQYLGCDELIQALEAKLWYRQHKPTDKDLFIATNDNNVLHQYLVHTQKYWFAGDEDDIQ